MRSTPKFLQKLLGSDIRVDFPKLKIKQDKVRFSSKTLQEKGQKGKFIKSFLHKIYKNPEKITQKLPT